MSSKNYKQILEDKKYLREKRLNSIFHKNNLRISHNTDEFHISNTSNNSKSNFAEKYSELYYITTNNSKSNNREKNKSVSYLLNNLRNMNYSYKMFPELYLIKIENVKNLNFPLFEYIY